MTKLYQSFTFEEINGAITKLEGGKITACENISPDHVKYISYACMII